MGNGVESDALGMFALHKTLIAFLVALLITAPAARAELLTETDGSFDIVRFEVEGNTVLKPSRLNAVLSRFKGEGRGPDDLAQAVAALEAAYRRRGFLAKVLLREAEPIDGVVHLTVIQPRMGKIQVSGNAFHSDANVRRSLPRFSEGSVPNLTDLGVDVRIANDNPSKKTTPQLQLSEGGDSIDAILQVADEKSWLVSGVLDNSGVGMPGRTHATFQYENFDLWGLDHILSLQYTTSPEHPSDIKVYGAGYHIPLYELGDSVDFYSSYSDVNQGSIAAGLVDLTVSGAGTVFGGHFTHNLPQLGLYNSQLIVGFDRKAFRIGLNAEGQELGGDVTVDPVSLSYAGQWVFARGNANIYLTAARNVPGGSQGANANFTTARLGATPNYALLRYSAGVTRSLPRDWYLRVAVEGQATHDTLIPGEQFGVGGAASVRGLEERQLTDDSGLTATAEIYTPDLCRLLHSAATHCSLLGFLDSGYLSNNEPLPGEAGHLTVSSTGIGLRLNEGRTLSLQMDYGQVFSTSAASLRGDRRLHALISVSY